MGPKTESDMPQRDWIRRERRKRGISQFKLAKALGITHHQLSRWERGGASPPRPAVRAIRDLLASVDGGGLLGHGLQLAKRKWTEAYASSVACDSRGDARRRPPAIPPPAGLRVAELAPGATSAARRRGSAPTALSLFSGCGGMSEGFRRAGFDVLGFAELEPSARRMHAANFPGSVLLAEDVAAIPSEAIDRWREAWGEVDVLFGGPPCQGFSLTGKRDRADARNRLFLEFARVAERLQPRCVVLENVRLLTSMRAPGGALAPHEIVRAFEAAGFTLSQHEVNANSYGVPQSRARVFFVGWRDGDPAVEFPPPTHGGDAKARLVTFRDATADLAPLESGEWSGDDPLHWAVRHPEHVLAWLRDVPEGKSAHENEDPGLRPPSGYNTTYKRIRWDEPCSTIGTTFAMISGSRNVHPQHTRSLTVREAARCQSFPDTFKFFGTWGEVRRVIGNAVPPLLAEQVARHVLGCL